MRNPIESLIRGFMDEGMKSMSKDSNEEVTSNTYDDAQGHHVDRKIISTDKNGIKRVRIMKSVVRRGGKSNIGGPQWDPSKGLFDKGDKGMHSDLQSKLTLSKYLLDMLS